MSKKLQADMTTYQTKGQRILVVDDNADDRCLQIAYLRTQSYRVYAAEDGLDGVEKARMVLPDLILMDVCMPVCDGIAACRLLKADPRTGAIPLIFLTSAAQPNERVRGLMVGAVDYITKPFDFEEVRLRVGIHLRAWSQPGETHREVRSASDHVSNLDTMIFRAAMQILHSNLAEPPDLASLATAVGTNARRLNESFRNYVGLTVFDYLREVRMEEARKMLRETNLAVQTVANDLGYGNAANFATAFRDRFGLSPRKYRQSPPDGVQNSETIS